MNEAERLAWVRLANTRNIGAVAFAELIERFGSASSAIEHAPRLAQRGGGNLVIADERAAARELVQLRNLGGQMIANVEPDYPQGLAALRASPPYVSILGDPSLLTREMVGIVGARNASALGRKFAHTLAQELAEAELVVVSGLARGIDTAAHEGALELGTIAVVAGGVDIVYPPENQKLYDAIRERGVVLSEMPLGQQPQARHFPRRNRIISGLSRGVVVIEAAERSGSLITANYAAEQGREVFAVPGSPLDPRARGSNGLIRQGATLTESADDVLAALRPIIGQGFQERERPPSALRHITDEDDSQIRRKIEEALGPSGVAIDELVRQTGASPAAVLTVILELELAGRLARLPGNQVAWV